MKSPIANLPVSQYEEKHVSLQYTGIGAKLVLQYLLLGCIGATLHDVRCYARAFNIREKMMQDNNEISEATL